VAAEITSDAGSARPPALASPLGRLRLPSSTDDVITHAVPMQREPYIVVGGRSGAVRVAMMTNASGYGVTAARQVRGLKLMPYISE